MEGLGDAWSRAVMDEIFYFRGWCGNRAFSEQRADQRWPYTILYGPERLEDAELDDELPDGF
jgi:hypothetical protein